jgi:membrane protease subunit HflK
MDAEQSDDGAWTPPRQVQIDPKQIGRLVMAGFGLLLLVVAAFSSYYTVEPDQKAVVLRFGRHIATNDPGLHFKLPFGIDRAITVPVTQVRKIEFGYGTAQAGVRTSYRPTTEDDEAVSLMLTGDLNIVDLSWVVQYQIADPERYLFGMYSPDRAVQDLGESAMRAVVGDHTIDEVLRNRETIASLMQTELQKGLTDYGCGIKIVTVQLQDVTPPKPVEASFNEVNKAQQERSRLENEAMQEYNRIIPLARGEAKRRVAEAEGYELDRVNRAKGEVARFTELLAAYKESPEVTRKRMYLEAIEEVLPKVRSIVVAEGDGVLKLLPLQRDGGGR